MSVFPWTKFWCRPDAQVYFTPDGFLQDPEVGSWANPNAYPFSDISGLSALVLLGEPGAGKSTTISAEFRRLKDAASSEDHFLFEDLRSAHDEQTIHRRVIQSHDFQSWLTEDGKVFIFLDSLDEALPDAPSLIESLLRDLREYDTSRICLRLACRTAAWPPSLSSRVKEVWGTDRTGVFELLSLRRRDVLEYATSVGLDGEAFVREIVERGVVGFAVKPLTLLTLVDSYAASGHLPESQKDLYVSGCLRLAEEPDSARQYSPRGALLSPAERLTVAERIAAVTLLTERDGIWTGPTGGGGEHLLLLSQVTGGQEHVGRDLVAVETTVDVGERELLDALSTGLFSARGETAVGFGHRSYAEFLAARHLAGKRPDIALDLLTVPDDPDGWLAPGLHGVGAFLASMDERFFERLLHCDPEVLLSADLTQATPTSRDSLFSVVLQLAARDHLSIYLPKPTLHALCSPAISQQVGDLLSNPNTPTEVLHLVLDMVEFCELDSLAPTLLSIAHDSSRPSAIRVQAISVLGVPGGQVAAELIPLLDLPAEQDPDDEIRAALLEVLWPAEIGIDEVLRHLSQPRRDDLIGGYRMFLTHGFAARLETAEIPAALRWAEQWPEPPRHSVLDDLIDSIVVKALEGLLQDSSIPPAVASYVAASLANRLCIARAEAGEMNGVLAADALRHALLPHVVTLVATGQVDARYLVSADVRVVGEADLSWMLKQLEECREEAKARAWAALIGEVVSDGSERMVELLDASTRLPVLAVALAPRLAAVALDSDTARRGRDWHEKRRRSEAERLAQEQNAHPSSDRIAKGLACFEAGETEAWLSVISEMLRKGISYHRPPDLRDSAGWTQASGPDRDRICSAAESYLLSASPQPAAWFGTNTIPPIAYGGYYAFQLLLHEQEEAIRSFGHDVWVKWAPALIHVPNPDWSDGDGVILLRKAYEQDSRSVLSLLLDLLAIRARENFAHFALRKLDIVHDAQVEQALLEKLGDDSLPAAAFGDILEHLIERSSLSAVEYAQGLVATPVARDGRRRDVAVQAATRLLLGTDQAFPHVWPAFAEDEDFGLAVVGLVAAADRFDRIVARKLSEEQLASFYLWLAVYFPHPDEYLEGAQWVDDRMRVTDFRDSLLSELTDRGTEEGIEQVARIKAAHPNLTWLDRVLRRARRVHGQRSSPRFSPAELLQLLQDPKLRMAESEQQLLDLVVEALERSEQHLHGENPAIAELWNEWPCGSVRIYRPKSENQLSDWLARFLRRDLVEARLVVSREVEVSRRTSVGAGLSPDLTISAFPTGSENRRLLQVPIEVKGCWHKDLLTALKDQLFERYMGPFQLKHGVYVVGYFSSPLWDSADRRSQRCRSREIEILRGVLREQAGQLLEQVSVTVVPVVLDLTMT